jgi:hypothetical protein
VYVGVLPTATDNRGGEGGAVEADGYVAQHSISLVKFTSTTSTRPTPHVIHRTYMASIIITDGEFNIQCTKLHMYATLPNEVISIECAHTMIHIVKCSFVGKDQHKRSMDQPFSTGDKPYQPLNGEW